MSSIWNKDIWNAIDYFGELRATMADSKKHLTPETLKVLELIENNEEIPEELVELADEIKKQPADWHFPTKKLASMIGYFPAHIISAKKYYSSPERLEPVRLDSIKFKTRSNSQNSSD